MPLALGVDELHGRLALAGEQAVDDPAVVRGDRVGPVVALHRAIRVEDVDQQLLRRMDRHPRELGAHLAPLARVHVALAAVLLEHRLAHGGVAAGEHHGQHLVDHLLPVGARQAAAGCDQLLGPLAELLVREFGEPIPLDEREIGEPDCAFLEPLDEHWGPGLVADGGAEGRLADRRRKHGGLVEDRLGRALGIGVGDGGEERGGDVGSRAGGDPAEEPVHDPEIGGPQEHEPLGGIAPVAVRGVGLVDRGEQRGRHPLDL